MQIQRQISRDVQTEVRGDTATIVGIAVPYEVDTTYDGQVERFAANSIDPATVVGAPLLFGHNYTDHAQWLGTITDAENTSDGLMVAAEIVDEGFSAKIRAASTPPGLSFGGHVNHAEQQDDGSLTYTDATLRELSVTTIPAYPDAEIVGVRHAPPQEDPMPDTDDQVTFDDLAALATRDDLTALEARMNAHETPAPAISVRDALAAGVREFAKTGMRTTRALADVLSSGNAGVLPPDWSSEMRDWTDRSRPCIANAGSMPFPATGYTLTVPKITQHTTVAARGTEKTEVPTQALTTDSDTFTAKWFAGAVDVALELIAQSDPSVAGIVADSLVGQYAIATEDQFRTDTLAAGTAHGAVLDTTSYAAFIADVLGVGEGIRAACGEFGNYLAATSADWQAILGLVDGEGRRVLATSGPTNADGSAQLTSSAVNIGGINVFHAPGLATSYQYAQKGLRFGEKPPVSLSSDNVALAGRDFGILGAIISAEFYADSVVKYAAA